MNYILHLNNFLEQAKKDTTLSTFHISLYMALFHYWNVNRFKNPFPIYRPDLMQLSKIGSKNTYHRHIRELHQTGYIRYHPALSKRLPVTISIIRFDIEPTKKGFQQLDLFSTKSGTSAAAPSSTGIDTRLVSDLTLASTTSDTNLVSNVVHLNKHINNKQVNSVCNTPTKKNLEKNVDKNAADTASATQASVALAVPALPEIEAFFRQHNYPLPEAQKFFYYNQGKSWMISETLPVTDWRSIAHKWMLNSKTQKTNNNATEYLHTPRDKNYSEPL